MMEPYLQRGEVLIRYETLYFQPRKTPRNICDVRSAILIRMSTGHVHKKYMVFLAYVF